jgi:galactitol-specific phosphotransferase system IIC component
MTTAQLQSGVTSVANEVLRNIVAIADVIVHARSVTENVDNMAKMLRKAHNLESTSPARAASLRKAARQIWLA